MKENDSIDAAGALGLMCGIAGCVVLLLIAVVISTVFEL